MAHGGSRDVFCGACAKCGAVSVVRDDLITSQLAMFRHDAAATSSASARRAKPDETNPEHMDSCFFMSLTYGDGMCQ